MDLFLTEEDYLPAEFDELPLDEAILRVREIEDERESSSRKNKSKDGKEKRKRPRDEDDDDDERSDGPDNKYSDEEDDGWLVNDLGDDGYNDEDEEDRDRVVTVKDGVKTFGEDEAEEEEEGDKKKKKKKTEEEKEKKPRRRINSAPRVVLNVDRLKNIGALAALPEIQKTIHFKGKGHEEEDLDRIMGTMEHWAHRVMPSMKFDDFIEKCEQLGSKKILKAFISKIRFNLALDTNGDIPGIDFAAVESDEEFAFDDDLPPMQPINAEDAFDAMMREAEEVVKQRAAAATSTTNSSSISGIQSTMTSLSLDKTITPMKSTSQTMNFQSTTPVSNKTPPSSSSSLTEEQRRKIAENARKAAEKRLSIQMARSQPIPTSPDNQ